MAYFVILVITFATGAGVVLFLTDHVRRSLLEQKRIQDAKDAQLVADREELITKQQQFSQEKLRLKAARSEFEARAISYDELQSENALLKHDLKLIDIEVRKQKLDRDVLRHEQDAINERINELGARYLKESVKWIGSSLNANNFASCKQRLQDVIERCRTIGLAVDHDRESELVANLKSDFEMMVRAAFVREEQARIKAQIREDQQRALEFERLQKQLAREKQVVEDALAEALARAKDQYSEEVESLKAQLAEAESRSQRAISLAQLTKAGYVYVISNIGSFGEDVFKVGMTRREDPLDRVKELGDASVPFPFDVHMMISSEDAPSLEHALHLELHKLRVNKANPKKEFFRAELDTIRELVEKHHGVVEYVVDAPALQYRESLTMTDAEEEYIESVFAQFEDANEPDADEE